MILTDADWVEAFRFLRSSGVSLSPEIEPQLIADLEKYLTLLLKKNELINLTAIREPKSALWKHLVDSLLLCRERPVGVLLDWGSGGGLPGIPLALFRRASGDSSPVFFLDSVGKKLTAIEEFCDELGIRSQFFHERGEHFLKRGDRPHIDSIVMRAVAPAERAITWLDPSIAHWIFFLGPQQVLEWENYRGSICKTFEMRISSEIVLPLDMGRRFFLYLDSKRST